MAYTVEAIETGPVINNPSPINEFDLPSKEFIGYDPKGTTSVTGSPIEHKEPDPKQEDKPEDVKEGAESPATEESVTLSPKISALARKEQAARRREQALAQREKELADKLAKADKYEALQKKLAAKDYSAADELGMTYDEYTNYLLNKQKSDDPNESRFQKLERENAELKKAQEEKEIRDYQANQALWKQEISKAIDENPEFKTIKKAKAQDLVLKHINDSFEEDDVELTVEQAAKEIEEGLKDRARKAAALLEDEEKPKEEKVLGPPKTSPKTITQNMTVTSHEKKPKPLHLMSEREQWEEAARRYQASRQQR
jgi:hypothetical protein